MTKPKHEYAGAIIARLSGHDEFFHVITIVKPLGYLAWCATASRYLQDNPEVEEIQINMGRDGCPRVGEVSE